MKGGVVITSLAALLAPHDPQVLHQAIRQRSRLHLSTANQAAYAGLLSWGEFNQQISLERVFSGDVQVLRRGRNLPMEMFSELRNPRGRMLLPDLLQKLCHAGLSLLLQGVHTSQPGIMALNAMLERCLRARVATNAYASFGRDSAFNTHHDGHDVLVLHLQGRKQWCSFGYRPEAYAAPGRVPEAALGAPVWQAVLQPGDLLFLPRGEVHRAEVVGSHCLHLTFSLTWPNAAELMQWLATAAAAEPLLAADIPVYGNAEELAAHAAALRAMLHRLADSLDISAFLASQDKQRKPAWPLNLGLADQLTPATWVQPVQRRRLALPPAGPAELLLDGVKFSLDAVEIAVLAALQEQDAMRLGDLQRLPGLAAEQVAEAVARLARQVLVRLSED